MLNRLWYTKNPVRWVLWPFSLLYKLATSIRRYYLQKYCCQEFSVPIIIVGNITVGGVGKTPFVIALADKLTQNGLRVGIVSRGYGATITQFPYEVRTDDLASAVGDEPLLLARNTKVPVVIAPKRTDAVNYLLENHAVQVVISDDGLQHYRMGRALEIVIVDLDRGCGNGLCLPAGPLRESIKRLRQVDFVVTNGAEMSLCPGEITQLTTGKPVAKSIFVEPVAAVAGIGNPKRFFNTLTTLGIKFTAYPFKDHHKFTLQDLNYQENHVIMTEKDAVKCLPFAKDYMYFLPVTAKLSDLLWNQLWERLELAIK